MNSNILHHVASSHFEAEIRTILLTLNPQQELNCHQSKPAQFDLNGTQRVDCWQIPTFILLLSCPLSDKVHLIVLINSPSFMNLYHSCARRAPHFTWCWCFFLKNSCYSHFFVICIRLYKLIGLDWIGLDVTLNLCQWLCIITWRWTVNMTVRKC